MKVCRKCGEEKPLDQFNKNRRAADGRHSRCKLCHRADVVDWQRRNRDKTRAKYKRWYNRHKEKVLRANRKWAENNPEKMREYDRKWRASNPEKVREKLKRWGEANRARKAELFREWSRRNPKAVVERARRRALRKRQSMPSWLTPEQKSALRAIYLAAQPGEHVDHIYPLRGKSAWGLHVPWNLQVIPAAQNLRKSNKLPEELTR